MKENLLVIAAALAVVFFLFQVIKGLLLARRPWKRGEAKADPELEALCKKANTLSASRSVLREIDALASRHDAKSRAVYYSAAGEIALTQLKRPNVAVRYFYRALRNNPKCESAFDRLAEILLAQKRHKRFERTCWGLLSRMDEEDTGSALWKKCWSSLANVYAGFPKSTQRADAIRKMLAAMASNDDDDDELDDLEDDTESDNDECACKSLPRIGS